MALRQKFIVVPFRKGGRGAIIPGEMRLANSEAQAERMAESMAKYCPGASAIEVYVDEESGDMISPRLIAEFGTAINLIEDLAA